MRSLWSSAVTTVISGFLLMSCGQTNQESEVKNVFGADDRQAITTDQYPWRTIGMVRIGGSACTGTLVARDLVLTAAHCVIDSQTKKLTTSPVYFYPNHKGGTHKDEAYAVWTWWGTNDPAQFRGDDWAIFKLNKAIGDQYGWLGILGTNVQSFPQQLSVAGYSGDFAGGQTAGVHHNCYKRGDNANGRMIFHDCDTARGSSGGPALRMYNNQLTIVGLNVAEYRNGGEESLRLPNYQGSNPNVVIPSGDFVRKVKELL